MTMTAAVADETKEAHEHKTPPKYVNVGVERPLYEVLDLAATVRKLQTRDALAQAIALWVGDPKKFQKEIAQAANISHLTKAHLAAIKS